MKPLTSKAIILTRVNYGEADRILTLLTPDHGKVRLMARGVRKATSKLAGGIELFSVSHISFIRGRGEIGTLISTRLVRHYEQIVKGIERTTAGYEFIRQLHRATEDASEAAYFELLEQSFAALNVPEVNLGLVRLWFVVQLLKLSGHMPNLKTDTAAQPLTATGSYLFDDEAMAFISRGSGLYGANHIKLLRLALAASSPLKLVQVQAGADVITSCEALAQIMLRTHVRI